MSEVVSVIFVLISGLIAIVIHENAHGWVAYLRGDDTAKSMGRLTLNPLSHIDPLGIISLVVFRIGWAKPVPINPLKFKNPRFDLQLVSIAGPLSNLLMAFLGVGFFYILKGKGAIFLKPFVFINVIFGIFNLIPIPPLDGGKIVASLLPWKFFVVYLQKEWLGSIVLIILILTGLIPKFIIPASVGTIKIMSKAWEAIL